MLPEKTNTKIWQLVGFDQYGNTHRHDIGQTINRTDTVINSINYVIYETESPDNCFFREEEGKVYRYDKTIETEYVIYDFTLSVGDIFQCHDGTEMQVVEKSLSKDYVSCKSNPDRIILRLKRTNSPIYEDIWMEGVGSVFTGLFSSKDFNEETCFVQFMTNSYTQTDGGDYAFFNINTNSYKMIWAQAQRLTTQEDFEDYINFEENKKNFDMDFIADTLLVKGYALLHNTSFAIQVSIKNDIMLLSLLENSYNSIIKGSIYKFDVKIPDFKHRTYTIKYDKHNDVILTCKGSSKDGDINSDGEVDINDVICIINHMAGAASWSKADVNSDNKVNINDVVSVINIMAATDIQRK